MIGSFAASAQNGFLMGQVIDSSGQPLANTSVSLVGTNKATQTSKEGRFLLVNNAGSYKLAVHAIGKKPSFIPVRIKKNDTTHLPSIDMANQNHILDELVVSEDKNQYKTENVSNSLRLMTPLEEVPQNIQVITSSVLKDRQIISMKDGIVRDVSGATRLGHWDNYTRINMRGSRASEFRNGFNFTSNWGPLTADMSMVERIEFVKGPAGFMMSNGEPGGMFNIVTKKPTGQTKGSANLTFGSFNLYRASLDLDGHLDKKNRLQYRLNLMGQTKESFQKYKYDDRYTIHPVLKYRIDEKTDLTVEYALQHAKISNIGSSYIFSAKGYGDLPRDFTLGDPGLEPTKINNQSLFVYLHHYFNKNWKLSVHAAYMHTNKVGSSLWPSSLDSSGNTIRNISIADAVSNYKFGQVFLNGKVQTGHIQHKILIGLDMGDKKNTYDWNQSHALDTKSNPFNIYNPQYGNPSNGYADFDRETSLNIRAKGNRLNQSYSGIYLQDQLGFWNNKIRLTLAGRYTYVKQSSYGTDFDASKITPRLGLSVSIDKNTDVYALVDQSFIPQTGLLRGNKLPDPETGTDYEIGAKKTWLNGHLQTSLAVYRIYKNGLLVSDPDTTNNADHRYSLQLGQSKSEGIELDIRGKIVKGLNAVVNYAYTNSEVTKDIDKSKVGNAIPGFAKQVFNGWLTYEIQNGAIKGLGFNAGVTYRADRSTWSWASKNQMSLPDYFRIDAGLFYQYKKMSVNLSIRNLLNKYLYVGAPYGDFYYWQMEAPRNFRLGITYDF